jgi:adenylate kinase family enzyme
MNRLILLSGPIAVGKSALAKELIADHRFKRISSGAYLTEAAKINNLDQSRRGLQELGDSLDLESDY